MTWIAADAGPGVREALEECEWELAWLAREVGDARAPEVDPAQWRGRAASGLARRLAELEALLGEAARRLADAHEAAARASRLEAGAADG